MEELINGLSNLAIKYEFKTTVSFGAAEWNTKYTITLEKGDWRYSFSTSRLYLEQFGHRYLLMEMEKKLQEVK